ncbi:MULTISPECIES: anti-CBASS protein Acb1 family protein [Enterobacterales]|uniref:anti-CBASS protein Acb1 family protein n=1 Tax=Enterobacterales TaxID=91347 RepID=UPI002EDA6C47
MTENEMRQLQRSLHGTAERRGAFWEESFGGTANTKRTRLYQEFGYPLHVGFGDFYRAYARNAIAAAAIKRMNDGCWEDYPEIYEGDKKEDATQQTSWDKQVNTLFKKYWKQIKGADKRNTVGHYSALLVQLKDGKEWKDSVDRNQIRLLAEKAIVKLIPVWEAQLEPVEWEDDPQSEKFGDPKMYRFTQLPVGNPVGSSPGRDINVHPDRVFILAEGADDDNPYSGESMLEAGFNKLLDIEKISGGSAEGFLKNASRQLNYNFSAKTDFANLAKALGVTEGQLSDALHDQTRRLNSNTDSAVFMQEGTASVLSVEAADPEPTWRTALNEFCATIPIAVKILIGMQTGERASTEDAKDWAKTRKSRRDGFLTEMIKGVVAWFTDLGIIPATAQPEITVAWSDLLAPSEADKIANMDKMADVAKKTTDAFLRPAVTENEVRAAGGMEPIKELNEPLPPPPTKDPLNEDDDTSTDPAAKSVGADTKQPGSKSTTK